MLKKVSVVIPTFNMASTLGKAIASVLSQSYSPLEIILVDDGSTDATQAIVDKIKETSPEKILYTRQDNTGKSSALNAGINNSTGEFIAFLDADDTLPRHSLEDRVNFLQFNPQLDAVFTDTNFQDSKGNTYSIRRPPKNLSQSELAFAFLSAIKTPFHLMSMMYRGPAFKKYSLFNQKYNRALDIDFAYRLLSEGKTGYLPRATYNYATATHDLPTRLKNRFKAALEKTHIIYSHTLGIQRAYLLALNFMIQTAKLGYDIYSHAKYGKS